MKYQRTFSRQALLSCSLVLLLLTPFGKALAEQQAAPYTKATRYNASGQVVGVIQSAPDAGKSFPATRNTYFPNGLLHIVEEGYLTSWRDESVHPKDWGSYFEVIKKITYSYDINGRKKTSSVSGTDGAIVSLTEYSYYPTGELKCRAVRMGLSETGDACSPQNDPTHGWDRVTMFKYNGHGDILNEIRAYGTPLEQIYADRTYYPTRLLKTVTDAGGNTSEMVYDILNRLRVFYFPSQVAGSRAANKNDYEEYNYDGNGSRTYLRKRDGRSITYHYDNLKRVYLKDYSDTQQQDIEYTYDLRGLELTAVYSATGRGVTRTYTGFGELESESTNVNGTTYTLTHTYDDNGYRERITYPDNSYFTYVRNQLNQVTTIKAMGSSTLLNASYDDAARPKTMTAMESEVAGSKIWYDSASRPDVVGYDFSGEDFDLYQDFSLNPAGQIIGLDISNPLYHFDDTGTTLGNYVPNGLNQYQSANAKTFAYDKNGNQTRDERTTYLYDMENRLILAGNDMELLYDPLGRLYQIGSKSGTKTYFLYDGDNLVAEYQNGVMTKRYVHGNGMQAPLISYDGGSITNSSIQFLHTNHQGSVIALSDSEGAVTAVNTYDPFGGVGSLTGRFGYTGQMFLPELDLYYYRARIYNPALGRFLQTDPVGYKDQMNLYAYVHNDPINFTDPTGKYGKGSGWTDEQWKKFDKVQQSAAKSMEKTAGKLEAKANKLEAKGKEGAAELRQNAGNLRAGAAALRSDGSDGKVANAMGGTAYVAAGGTPGGAAAVNPNNRDVMLVNSGHSVWSAKSNDTQRAWIVGHESLHTAGMGHGYSNGITAYYMGNSAQIDAFHAITGTSEASNNPDHLMKLVFPNF